MKKLITGLLILIMTGLFQSLSAQVTIQGVLKDNKGNPVGGASVSIKDSYDGATTDSLGRYSFKTSEKGEHLLQVSSIGFKLFEQTIKLESGILTIDATLKQEISELTAVVISAGTFE